MEKKVKGKKGSNVKNLFSEDKEPVKRLGSYIEIEGDLIKLAKQGNFDFIGHGCNCFATMGAGIALPIGIEFPATKRADKMFDAPSYMRLGNFSMGLEKVYPDYEDDSVVRLSFKNLRIINFYSQFDPGRNLDKEALILSLRKFALFRNNSMTFNEKQWRIGLPLIGCGIAGGDWVEVREIIKTELSEFDVTIVHFKE